MWVVSPGMCTSGTMRDPIGLGKGKHFCRDTRLRRWLWDGFKRQVDAFKPKVDGPIQTEFEEDFIFRADAHRLMRQDLKELILEPQSEIVGELTFGLNAQDF